MTVIIPEIPKQHLSAQLPVTSTRPCPTARKTWPHLSLTIDEILVLPQLCTVSCLKEPELSGYLLVEMITSLYHCQGLGRGIDELHTNHRHRLTTCSISTHLVVDMSIEGIGRSCGRSLGLIMFASQSAWIVDALHVVRVALYGLRVFAR